MRSMIPFTLILAGVLTVGCRNYDAPPPAPEPTPAPAPAPEPTYDDPVEPAIGSDAEIHDAVHEALRRAPGIDESTIEVRVENGDVHLGGWVRSQAEHDAAHEVAHAVEGVRRVFHSELEIR